MLRPYLRVVVREGPLDSDGALEGSGSRWEGGHDAVAGVLDLTAAAGLEGIADDSVVRSHHLLCLRVPEALGEGRGALHVGEKDGNQPAGSSHRCCLSIPFA